jgi:hypothetical protein
MVPQIATNVTQRQNASSTVPRFVGPQDAAPAQLLAAAIGAAAAKDKTRSRPAKLCAASGADPAFLLGPGHIAASRGETAGAAQHSGRGGTNASGATWCGRPDAPSPRGISDGYNGLNPPPVGAVSLAAGESGIRGLSGAAEPGHRRDRPLIAPDACQRADL